MTMPVVEKVRGSRVNVRGIGEFTVGDRAEVSTSDATYLVEERGDFEIVDAGNESDDAVAAGDAEEFVDRTPVSDVADDIEAGTVDEVLNEVEAAESANRDRSTVHDAIEARRAELEG
jgi:hypothetical protein